MVKIKPRPGEKIDRTLRRFKRLCDSEGINKEIRKHEYYETPSQVRRRKRQQAIKRCRKEQNLNEKNQF